MKRLFCLLLLTLSAQISTTSLGHAQNIAYEVIRTPEAPGYFALRVYPGADLPALEVETVFVENFTNKTERQRYQKLSKNLTNTGLQVISSSQGVALVNDSNYRLVLLGGPKQNQWLQFQAPTGQNLIESFNTFSQQQLGPVYLSHITAEFGGNIKQVRPQAIPFLDDTATYFVGKFETPMKTRVQLSGETPHLVVQADGVVDLTTYQPHQADKILSELWNELLPHNLPLPSKGELKGLFSLYNLKKLVTNSFPWLIALMGLAIMYLATRTSKLRTGMAKAIDDEFWNTPIEETPLYTAWEKSLPWELSDEELRLVA